MEFPRVWLLGPRLIYSHSGSNYSQTWSQVSHIRGQCSNLYHLGPKSSWWWGMCLVLFILLCQVITDLVGCSILIGWSWIKQKLNSLLLHPPTITVPCNIFATWVSFFTTPWPWRSTWLIRPQYTYDHIYLAVKVSIYSPPHPSYLDKKNKCLSWNILIYKDKNWYVVLLSFNSISNSHICFFIFWLNILHSPKRPVSFTTQAIAKINHSY